MLEASAAGLPIINPVHGGIDEFVSNNQSGITTETDSSELLAQAIIKLYKDKNLRHRFGHSGQDMVDNFYTIDKMIRTFLNIITTE